MSSVLLCHLEPDADPRSARSLASWDTLARSHGMELACVNLTGSPAPVVKARIFDSMKQAEDAFPQHKWLYFQADEEVRKRGATPIYLSEIDRPQDDAVYAFGPDFGEMPLDGKLLVVSIDMPNPLQLYAVIAAAMVLRDRHLRIGEWLWKLMSRAT